MAHIVGARTITNSVCLGFRILLPENQMEKKTEMYVETGVIEGSTGILTKTLFLRFFVLVAQGTSSRPQKDIGNYIGPYRPLGGLCISYRKRLTSKF